MATGPVSEAMKRFLMARANLKLADFGVEGDHEQNVDRLVELYHARYAAYTIDELLLRPREAIRFCDAAREMFDNIDVPDDIILRPVLNRRKNP